MSTPLSPEESRELIKICQSGKLYAIRDWISAGKSLRTASETKKTVLSVAIKTGFHSLVELIAPHETQEAKNRGLADAVRQKRLDLVELLVACGAEIKAVPFTDVLLGWEPRIIQFFIDNGADIITGSPFAVAFGEKIRTALRPFLQCKRRYPELADALQEQADRALRKFAYDGDLKWVSLMMWAGADPRSRGLMLGDEQFGRTEEERAELAATTLMEACYQENVDVLRKLKPDPSLDNLTELLNCAAGLSQKEIIKYLLELGAQPNDKANGASTAMDRCLLHLPHESIDALIHRRQVSSWEVRRSMESLSELAKHGAIWQPDDSRKMDYIRRGLYQVNPEVTVDLLELFVKIKCCSAETIQLLLRTARIRQHLKPFGQRLLRLRLDLRTPREKAEHARIEAERAQINATQEAYLLATRYNRERLYEEVWSEPVIVVAKRYGLSDVGLAKICKKLDIPRPGLRSPRVKLSESLRLCLRWGNWTELEDTSGRYDGNCVSENWVCPSCIRGVNKALVGSPSPAWLKRRIEGTRNESRGVGAILGESRTETSPRPKYWTLF